MGVYPGWQSRDRAILEYASNLSAQGAFPRIHVGHDQQNHVHCAAQLVPGSWVTNQPNNQNKSGKILPQQKQSIDESCVVFGVNLDVTFGEIAGPETNLCWSLIEVKHNLSVKILPHRI